MVNKKIYKQLKTAVFRWYHESHNWHWMILNAPLTGNCKRSNTFHSLFHYAINHKHIATILRVWSLIIGILLVFFGLYIHNKYWRKETESLARKTGWIIKWQTMWLGHRRQAHKGWFCSMVCWTWAFLGGLKVEYKKKDETLVGKTVSGIVVWSL